MTNLLRALGGEYVPPEAGGDLLRDGPGVLPTGKVCILYCTVMLTWVIGALHSSSLQGHLACRDI